MHRTLLSSLHELVNSPWALLKSLTIEPAPLLLVVVVSDGATKSLCDVLFGQLSLSELNYFEATQLHREFF